MQRSRAAALADRLAPAALVLWAAGTVLAEPLAQIGAYALALVVPVRLRDATISRDLRRFAAAAVALAAWQAISPAIARWAGSAPGWPRSGRYGQFFDTLAPALAGLAAAQAPWTALASVLAIGWALSVGLGLYQHYVRWPFDQPWWLKTPVDRVRESFSLSGPPRYGAGGFLFHRLRFAHGAVATLGPVLAVLFRSRRTAVAAAALVLTAGLVAATFISYARAALVVAVLITAAAVLILGRGRWRAAAGVVLLVAGLAVLSSAEWRSRIVRVQQNLFGEQERRLSMEVALDLVHLHPVLGVGFGNYQEAAWATRRTTSVTPLLSIDAHDLWLTAWVETGLIGFLLTIAYHALLFLALLRRCREGSWIAAGAVLSFAGFHLLSLVHYLQHHTGVYLSFALAWGLGLAPAAATASPALGLPAPAGSASPAGEAMASTVASSTDGQSWMSTRSMEARKNQTSG